MLNNELREMIDLYFDNEMKKENETVLFEMLAQSTEAREYFSNLHRLSKEISAADIEFPAVLEEKIFNSLKEKKNTGSFLNYRVTRVMAYAAVIVIIIAGLFIFNEASHYRKELITLNKKISNQNETIQQLYNSIPSAVVVANRKDEIIVKAKL